MPLGGVHPIVVGETLCRLTSQTLCLHFWDAFATHLSPHQFEVATKGECETIIHGIKCTLDLLQGALGCSLTRCHKCFQFNVKRGHISKLCVVGGDIIQLIPFVHAFYAFESSMFYRNCNCDGNIMVIPFAMGTHQGDLLGGALFALVHLRALHSTVSHFPSCLFPSIINDTHIIDPLSIVSFACMSIFRLNYV